MKDIFSSLLSDNIDLQDNVVKDNAKSEISSQSQRVFKSVFFFGWVTLWLVLVSGHLSEVRAVALFRLTVILLLEEQIFSLNIPVWFYFF